MKSGEQVSWRKLVGVEGSPHTADQQLEALGDSPNALQYHISQPSGTPRYKPQGGGKKCLVLRGNAYVDFLKRCADLADSWPHWIKGERKR